MDLQNYKGNLKVGMVLRRKEGHMHAGKLFTVSRINEETFDAFLLSMSSNRRYITYSCYPEWTHYNELVEFPGEDEEMLKSLMEEV